VKLCWNWLEQCAEQELGLDPQCRFQTPDSRLQSTIISASIVQTRGLPRASHPCSMDDGDDGGPQSPGRAKCDLSPLASRGLPYGCSQWQTRLLELYGERMAKAARGGCGFGRGCHASRWTSGYVFVRHSGHPSAMVSAQRPEKERPETVELRDGRYFIFHMGEVRDREALGTLTELVLEP